MGVNGWAHRVALTPFVPLSRTRARRDYGVRKRSFRMMLTLRFSTPNRSARQREAMLLPGEDAAREVVDSPPSLRFPPLREGNRVGRVGSVPPACRGNLKEGVIGHTRFCKLWLRDWYDKGTSVRHRIAEAGAIFPAWA